MSITSLIRLRNWVERRSKMDSGVGTFITGIFAPVTFWMSNSSYICLRPLKMVKARPFLPARPVRPMRWM